MRAGKKSKKEDAPAPPDNGTADIANMSASEIRRAWLRKIEEMELGVKNERDN